MSPRFQSIDTADASSFLIVSGEVDGWHQYKFKTKIMHQSLGSLQDENMTGEIVCGRPPLKVFVLGQCRIVIWATGDLLLGVYNVHDALRLLSAVPNCYKIYREKPWSGKYIMSVVRLTNLRTKNATCIPNSLLRLNPRQPEANSNGKGQNPLKEAVKQMIPVKNDRERTDDRSDETWTSCRQRYLKQIRRREYDFEDDTLGKEEESWCFGPRISSDQKAYGCRQPHDGSIVI